MTENEFNYYLSWLLLLTVIPTACGSIICLLWLRIVQRKISKAVFILGFFIFLSMSLTRLATSFDFDNYPMRLINAGFIIIGGIIANVPFFWAYLVQKREKMKRSLVENQLIELSFSGFAEDSFKRINPDVIFDLIHTLHPKDAEKLVQKFT